MYIEFEWDLHETVELVIFYSMLYFRCISVEDSVVFEWKGAAGKLSAVTSVRFSFFLSLFVMF